MNKNIIAIANVGEIAFKCGIANLNTLQRIKCIELIAH